MSKAGQLVLLACVATVQRLPILNSRRCDYMELHTFVTLNVQGKISKLCLVITTATGGLVILGIVEFGMPFPMPLQVADDVRIQTARNLP